MLALTTYFRFRCEQNPWHSDGLSPNLALWNTSHMAFFINSEFIPPVTATGYNVSATSKGSADSCWSRTLGSYSTSSSSSGSPLSMYASLILLQANCTQVLSF
jgi:hypothetical protein